MTTTQDNKAAYHHGDLRQALLRAGEAEIEAAGIEGFSLRRVARRAGVSHAAPAHHFRDVNALLTALAAEGFRLFMAEQDRTEAAAASDSRSQLVAAGLGYVVFARAHPALFRLMFASARPCFDDAELEAISTAAYMRLVERVSAVLGRPAMADAEGLEDVSGIWAIVHGLADLMISDRLGPIAEGSEAEVAARVERIVARMMPPSPAG